MIRFNALRFNYRQKLPLILQQEQTDCGHACVAMISHFLGHDIDLFHVRRMNKPSLQGTSMLTLYELFEDLGFLPRPLSVPLEEIHLIKCPAILHWDMNHYVVLKKMTRRYAIIHDPAIGLRKCSRQDLSQCFTGIVLEVDKPLVLEKITSKTRLSCLSFINSIKGKAIFLGCLITVSFVLELLTALNPLFIQWVTDDVIRSNSLMNLPVIALLFGFVTVMIILLDYLRRQMTLFVSHQMMDQFSANVLKHLLHLPLDFFSKRHRGDIQSKFSLIAVIQQKLGIDLINALLDGIMMSLCLLMMFIYSYSLSIVVLVRILCYSLLRYLTFQQVKKPTSLALTHHAEAATHFLETVQAMPAIKSFLKENTCFNRWRNVYIKALNSDIRLSRMTIFYALLQQGLGYIEQLILVCWGAWYVVAHHLSLGMLIAFLSYRLLCMEKSSAFVTYLFDYQLTLLHLERLGDILLEPSEMTRVNHQNIPPIQGRLLVKNVSFYYDSSKEYVLKNISLTINAGEKVAIVGPSGCGKSTLIKVLMGLLAASEGTIFLDDMPLSTFGLKNYRELTAAVMQDDHLLSGSIVENITFFADSYEWPDVYQAAKLAFIHDVINALPMRYETLVGDLGSLLSGGQKQRLLLARALYKKPKILFLDEATSHLDNVHEKAINASIKALSMTQIIIAHRQETIAMADRVIHLEHINGDLRM